MTRNVPLLVVDMQVGFVNSRSQHVVDSVVEVVKAWQSAGLPTYFTRFINEPGSQWERLIGWRRLQSSPETDLIPELSQLAANGSVFEKRSYTSIVGDFRKAVEGGAWQEVALCGIATDGCVLESAVDLFQRNIRPVVLIDACASHAGNEIHNMGLTLLGRAVGRDQLLNSTDYLAEISR